MPFRDVAVGSWFYDDIAYVYQNDIMDGVSGTTFAPDNTTSRGRRATVLYCLSQDQAPVFEEIFTDVHAHQWFANGIIWAYQKNVVNGYDDGNFGPDDDVTREQFAAMLYRYAQSRQYDTSASADLGRFGDAGQVSDYARNAMAWAVAEEMCIRDSSGRLHFQGFPTSNHYGATADGLVIAYRAGVSLVFQDTMQYHPTGVLFPEQLYGCLLYTSAETVPPWASTIYFTI